MYIDSHVHLRDEEQAYKETIAHGLEVARDSGVDAVFDMPNPKRPVFNYERVKERLNLARHSGIREVFYGTFIGATADKEQLKSAVGIWRRLFPRVVGIKMYDGHSVGNLGVITEEDQELAHATLAEEGYTGLWYHHAEKEKMMNENAGTVFTPSNPITHCLTRPWQAEYESVKDQIRFAKSHKFKGKLHIAHISHPKSVDLVCEAKKDGLDISCGVCPHHFIYDWTQMQKPDGIKWKMNPPLREPGAPNQMLENLRVGKINWIETDHAPHSLDEKMKGSFMSGIPGIPWWPLVEEYLRFNNFGEDLIRKVTFENVAERFGIDLKRTTRPIKDRRSDYPFNPYTSLEQQLKWRQS